MNCHNRSHALFTGLQVVAFLLGGDPDIGWTLSMLRRDTYPTEVFLLQQLKGSCQEVQRPASQTYTYGEVSVPGIQSWLTDPL